jgi:hypothetical protein
MSKAAGEDRARAATLKRKIRSYELKLTNIDERLKKLDINSEEWEGLAFLHDKYLDELESFRQELQVIQNKKEAAC